MRALISQIQQFDANNAGVQNAAVFQWPELILDNVAFTDLVCKLQWNPTGITAETNIDEFVRSRYGSNPGNLGQAWHLLLDSVYNQGLGLSGYKSPNNPFYQFAYVGFGAQEGFPIVSDFEKWNLKEWTHFNSVLPSMRQALDLFLSESGRLSGNPLYENDLVDLARTYLGLLCNRRLIEAYAGFRDGSSQRFEQHVSEANTIMLAVENILSTRRDYSLTDMIRRVMSVPGTNEFTPEMIRQGNIVADYPTRDCWEIMHTYYRPKVQIYFDLLRKKLQSATSTVSMSEFQQAFQYEFFAKVWTSQGITSELAYSGKKSVKIDNGGGASIPPLAIQQPGEDISLEARVYPVSQSGNGKLTYVVQGVNAQGQAVVSLSYVLIGAEDYWSNQNVHVGGCYYVTRVINLPQNQWSHFLRTSAKASFVAQFPGVDWASLGIAKYNVSLVSWQAGGTIQGYVDDVSFKQVQAGVQTPLNVISSDFETDPGCRVNKWILTDQTVPDNERFNGTTITAIQGALNAIGPNPDPNQPFPTDKIISAPENEW